MTIRLASAHPVTEADLGKFACPHSPMIGGLCAGPYQIAAVAKSRLTLRREGRSGSKVQVREKVMMAKSIVFVCDTEAEGEQVYALSAAKLDALRRAQDAVHASYAAKLKELLGAA